MFFIAFTTVVLYDKGNSTPPCGLATQAKQTNVIKERHMPTTDIAPADSLEDRVMAALNEDVSTNSATEDAPVKQDEQSPVQAETAPEEASQDEEDTEQEDEPDTDGEAEVADGDATKNQNRVGYQLRQLRQKDDFVVKSRETLNNWVNGTEDPQEARLRQMEANQYLADVERSRAQLVTDGDRVQQEIPLFNPNDASFDQALYNRALQRYSRDQLITETVDNVPQITGYKQSLLDYMREEADAYYAGVESAARRSQAKVQADESSKKKKQAKMDDAGEVTSGSISPETSKPDSNAIDDAFLAGFDSVR